MESLTHESTIEIGVIRYTFDIEFNYYPGTNHLDPTEQEEAELYDWDFDGPIYAWDMEEEIGYDVENEKEIKMLKDWIDIDELFYEAMS